MDRRVKRVTQDSPDPMGSHLTHQLPGPRHQRTTRICTRVKRVNKESRGHLA